MGVQFNVGSALFTHFWLLFCLLVVLGMVQLVFNALSLNKTNENKVDNTPGPLRTCALNEALDACLYSYMVLKVHTPSVIK